MVCPTIVELENYVGGSASEVGGASVDAHIAGCVRCREEVREIRENQSFLFEALRDLGDALDGGAAQLNAAPLTSFRILREIARGGQGVIHEAVQLRTKRRIALKIIEPGEPNALRRFEREAELASGLRHPNIVTIYESEMLPDGRYALAMEYVEGVRLDEWVQAKNQECSAPRESAVACIRTKLEMFLRICDGVHHAHVNGVIHRDLKPSNILVTHDESPRIVDFGIARRVANATHMTRAGGFAGTLAYASPEQVSGERGAVDTRTDVYSLGLILYELLTARKPYDTESSLSCALANITKTPPEPMRLMQPGDIPVGSELESIVGKALAKDREDRYQSVAGLRSDVENWLSGRPVQAHHQHTMYLVRKLIARHRFGFSVCLAFVLLCTVLAASMAWSSQQLSKQAVLLSSALSSNQVERARLLGVTGESSRAESMLWGVLAESGVDLDDPALCFHATPIVRQAAWGLHELYSRHPSLLQFAAPAGIRSIGFNDDDTVLCLVYQDGSQLRVHLSDGYREELPGEWSVSSSQFADVNAARSHVFKADTGSVMILDVSNGTKLRIAHPMFIRESVRDVNRDASRMLITCKDHSLQLWSISPVEPIAELASGIVEMNKAVFSDDGRWITAGVRDRVYMWDAEDGREIGSWLVPAEVWRSGGRAVVYTTSLGRDGDILAAGVHNDVVIYDPRHPGSAPRVIRSAHRGFVAWIGFSPDGSIMLTYGSERNCKVWDSRTGRLLGTIEHDVPLRIAPAIASSGGRAAICDENGGVRVFECHPNRWFTRLGVGARTFHSVQFSRDGSMIGAVSADGMLSLWDASDQALLWSRSLTHGSLETLCFAPDGRTLAVGGEEGVVVILPTDGSGDERMFATGLRRLTWIGFSGDGAMLGAAGSSSGIEVFEVATGRLIRRLEGHLRRVVQAVFTSDGSTLISVGTDGRCIAWDVATGTELYRTAAAPYATRAVAISPLGDVFVTGSDDWKLRVWDLSTGALLRTISGVKQHVFGLAFHPEGRVLFSCGRDSAMQVWDMHSGRELAVLRAHDDLVLSIGVSPDGKKLVSASADCSVGIWDLGYYTEHMAGSVSRWISMP